MLVVMLSAAVEVFTHVSPPISSKPRPYVMLSQTVTALYFQTCTAKNCSSGYSFFLVVTDDSYEYIFTSCIVPVYSHDVDLQ